LGLKPDFLERLEQGMHEHALKILFVAKLTVSFMIPSLIAAGLMKVPWKRWFPGLFAGEMLWTGSLVLIGYYTTEAIKRVERGIEYLLLGLSVVFVLFLLWLGRRILKNRYKADGMVKGNHET
jgi:membrane protein DedA with SNARE-associated domain